MDYPEANKIQAIIEKARKVVIIQADNPDGDSLGSALAMEHILGDMGKETFLFCAVDIPTYLRYMSGWDRVQKDLPTQFDASVIVDASTMTLLERLEAGQERNWLAAKPCIVLDHHEIVENPIPFATVTINDSGRASAGELVYQVSQQLGWAMSLAAKELIATTILSDTQGLTNQLASADTYRLMADLIEDGVDRPKLEETRREAGKMEPEIFRYKAELVKRSQFTADGCIAYVDVPQDEIKRYSPLYNPAPLVQGDMLQTVGVLVAIVFKVYDDGKITGAIRCNPSAPVAAKIAQHLGGGGHDFASGFKVTDGRTLDEVRSACITFASELVDKL